MLGKRAACGLLVLGIVMGPVRAQAQADAEQGPAAAEVEPAPAPLQPEPTVGAATPTALPVQSEVDLFKLDSEVAKVSFSIASKRQQTVDDAPGSVTVITRQQIRDMNALSLSDVLNALVPGMDSVPTYFRYGDHNTGVYSRGLLSDFSQQVLFLLNGQTKYNESTYGSPYMAIQFNLENVERIEVSRTPVPLQGGGAITVINLVTREQYLHNGGQAFLNLSANQDDFTSTVMQAIRVTGIYGHDVGPLRVSASVQYYTDHGQQHSDPSGRGDYLLAPTTLRDGIRTFANFTFAVQSKDDRFLFHSWFQYVLEDPFLAGQTPTASSDPYRYDGLQWLTAIRARPWRQLHLSAGSMVGGATSITDYAGAPYLSSVSNYHAYLEGYYDFRFSAAGQHSLIVGGKIEREGQFANQAADFIGDHFEREAAQQNRSRNVFSLFVDESWRALRDRLTLAGGARADVYQGYGDQVEFAPSGRVSIQARPRRELGLSLVYATVVRPPSIYERIGVGDPSLVGSPDVTSERVQTVEASLSAKLRGLKVQVTPFFQHFSDKIEYVPDPENVIFRAHNNGSTRVLGIDLDLRYNFTPRSYVFANGSYVNSQDLNGAMQTFFLPSVYVNFGGNYHYRGLNLNAYAWFRDKRPLPDALVINTQNTTYNFTLNTSVAYSFWKGLRVYVLVENLSGIRNNIPLSTDRLMFPTRGRTFHLGLQYGASADSN